MHTYAHRHVNKAQNKAHYTIFPVKVNAKFGDKTLLHFATAEGRVNVTRVLLEHKADIRALVSCLSELHVVLLWMEEKEQVCVCACVRECVRACVRVSEKATCRSLTCIMYSGRNFLFVCFFRIRLEILLCITQHTCKFCQCETQPFKHTHTHYSNHYQVAELLLDAGSDVNLKGIGGNTPIHIAAALGHCRLLKLFLNQPNPDVNPQVICSYMYMYMYMYVYAASMHIQLVCIYIVHVHTCKYVHKFTSMLHHISCKIF